MKKNKILSVVLALMVAFTMVFAGSGSVFASSTTNGTDTIEAANINTATDTEEAPDLAELIYSSSASDSVLINVPTAGAISLRVCATEASYAYLYDAEGNSVYGYGASLEPSTSETDYKYAYFPISAAGVYKLEMTTSSANQVYGYVDAFYYPKGGTPTKGADFYGASPDGKVAYYKIKATGNGYITVEFPWGYNDPASYSVKLYNSKKKAVFKKGFEYVGETKEYKTRIGVTKGTYYIGVKTTDPCYGINLDFKKVTEKSGSKKGKAVKLSKGKAKRGIITATQSSKSGDWYKFTISKSQKVNLEISTLTSQGGGYGGLKVSIYSGKTSYPFGSQTFNYNLPNDTLAPYTIGLGEKLQKGTYYVKIQKYDEGSGYYKIKWQ